MSETRVVLDTSVLFPALFVDQSSARRALRRMVRVCWRVVLSADLLDECVNITHEHGRRGRMLRSYLHAFAGIPEKAEWVAVDPVPEDYYPSSPKDRHVFAAAEQGRAQFIVQRNPKDFEGPEITRRLQAAGTTVLDPKQTLERLRDEQATYEPPRGLEWLFAGANADEAP